MKESVGGSLRGAEMVGFRKSQLACRPEEARGWRHRSIEIAQRLAGGERRHAGGKDRFGACGAEAARTSPEMEIIAAASLIRLANHFRGTQVLARPQPKIREASSALVDLKNIKARRLSRQ